MKTHGVNIIHNIPLQTVFLSLLQKAWQLYGISILAYAIKLPCCGTWDGDARNALYRLTEAGNTVKYQTIEPEYIRTKDK